MYTHVLFYLLSFGDDDVPSTLGTYLSCLQQSFFNVTCCNKISLLLISTSFNSEDEKRRRRKQEEILSVVTHFIFPSVQ